jgi:hypothetical protein
MKYRDTMDEKNLNENRMVDTGFKQTKIPPEGAERNMVPTAERPKKNPAGRRDTQYMDGLVSTGK